jgi:hypothetical protein
MPGNVEPGRQVARLLGRTRSLEVMGAICNERSGTSPMQIASPLTSMFRQMLCDAQKNPRFFGFRTLKNSQCKSQFTHEKKC